LLLSGLAAAQESVRSNRIFPSDSQTPHLAGGPELLEAVCPGRVEAGKQIGCRTACPDFTTFPAGRLQWSLVRVTHGHFLSPSSDDAVLAMGGCEPHSLNFGGSILLTRRSQKWRMLWYKAGVPTDECRKVALPDGREILVCLGGYGAQGYRWTALYVEDLRAPRRALMAGEEEHFFQVFDDTANCGMHIDSSATPLLTHTHIDKVVFSVIRGRSTISVTASLGRRRMTQADAQACVAEQNRTQQNQVLRFLPRTRTYSMAFEFDRGTYKWTASSASLVKLFAQE
jgi:hypothetical protein